MLPGLSKSVDNGKTWNVLFPDSTCLRIAFHHNLSEVVLVAATGSIRKSTISTICLRSRSPGKR